MAERGGRLTLSQELRKAVDALVEESGVRREQIDPYALFHHVRDDTRAKAAAIKDKILQIEEIPGVPIDDRGNRTKDVRLIGVRVIIAEGQDMFEIASQISKISSVAANKRSDLQAFLATMATPYKGDCGQQVLDCVIRSHYTFDKAYDVCCETMEEHQIKYGKSAHDQDSIINQASVLTFEKTIGSLLASDAVLQVSQVSLGLVEERIANEAQGRQAGTSMALDIML